MSGPMLVALVAVVVAVIFAGFSWRLARQVRRLEADVDTLRPAAPQPVGSASRPAATPAVAVPPAVASGPGVEASADQTAILERPPEPDERPDLVLTPTPIGPSGADSDLSVARVASVTLAVPLVKALAFSHGVRRALLEESRMRVSHAFRKELRRQRRLRRRRAGAAGPPRATWRRR